MYVCRSSSYIEASDKHSARKLNQEVVPHGFKPQYFLVMRYLKTSARDQFFAHIFYVYNIEQYLEHIFVGFIVYITRYIVSKWKGYIY